MRLVNGLSLTSGCVRNEQTSDVLSATFGTIQQPAPFRIDHQATESSVLLQERNDGSIGRRSVPTIAGADELSVSFHTPVVCGGWMDGTRAKGQCCCHNHIISKTPVAWSNRPILVSKMERSRPDVLQTRKGRLQPVYSSSKQLHLGHCIRQQTCIRLQQETKYI